MSAHTQASSPGVYYDPRWYANASPYIVPNGQPAPVSTAQYPYYPVPAIYPYAHAPYGYYPAIPEKMIPQPAITSADPSTADRPAPAAKRPKISTITSGVWPSSHSSQSPVTNPDSPQKDVVVPQYPITLQHPQPYTPTSIPLAYYYHPYLSASQPAAPQPAPQPAAPQPSDVPASKAEALGHAHTSSGVQVPHKDMSPPPIVTLTPPEDSRTISASTPPPPIVTVTPPEESPSAASGTHVSPPIQDHPQPPEERGKTAVESSFPEQAPPTDPEDPVADTVLSPSKIALPLSPITNHPTMASYSAQTMPSISSAIADLSISEERGTVDAEKKADVPTVVDLRHSHPRPSTGPSLPASIEAAPVLREGPMDLSLLTHSESERKPKTSRTRPSRSGSGPVYTAVTQPSDLSSKEHRPVARARTFPYPVAPNAPPLHFLPPPPVPPPPYPKPQGALQTATSKLASKLRLRRQPPPIIPIPLNPLITAMPPFPSPTRPAALKSSMSGGRQPGDDSTRPPSLTRSEYTTSTGTVPTPTSAAFPSSPTIQSPPSSSSSSKRKPRASRPGMVISFNSPGEKYYGFMNTSPYKIYYNKRLYPTAEHLFQAFKFLSPRPGGLGLGGALGERIGLGSGGIGARIAERIRSIPDPMEASSEAGMNWEYQRDDWEEIATEKMEEVLYMKFTQHDGLRAELVSTHPAQLVWASPRDSYYGAGPNGKGRNELGRLLMHVRDRLKAEGGL